jgi:2-keto-4-pentenoate hydratase
MTLTPEQLAALRPIAEKARTASQHLKESGERASLVEKTAIREFTVAFDPATCLALLEEVERLTEENQRLYRQAYSED